MATFDINYILKVTDRMSPRLQQISKNLSNIPLQVSRSLIQAEKQFQSTFSSLERMSSKAMTAFTRVSVPLGLSIGKAIKDFADFEKLEIGISTVLTNTGKTEQEIKSFLGGLENFSVKSPFKTQEVYKLSQIMMAVGFTSEGIIDNMRMFGDITQGSGADLNRLLMNYAQVKGLGYLQLIDAKQFAYNNIPIFDMLSKKLGVGVQEVMELISAGEVSFKTLEETLSESAKQGGLYYQAMEKGMASFWGVVSATTDELMLLTKSLGGDFIEATGLKSMIASIGGVFSKLRQDLQDTNPLLKKFISFGALAAMAVPPATLAILGLTKAFYGLKASMAFGGDLIRNLTGISSFKGFRRLSKMQGVVGFNKLTSGLAFAPLLMGLKNFKTSFLSGLKMTLKSGFGATTGFGMVPLISKLNSIKSTGLLSKVGISLLGFANMARMGAIMLGRLLWPIKLLMVAFSFGKGFINGFTSALADSTSEVQKGTTIWGQTWSLLKNSFGALTSLLNLVGVAFGRMLASIIKLIPGMGDFEGSILDKVNGFLEKFSDRLDEVADESTKPSKKEAVVDLPREADRKSKELFNFFPTPYNSPQYTPAPVNVIVQNNIEANGADVKVNKVQGSDGTNAFASSIIRRNMNIATGG